MTARPRLERRLIELEGVPVEGFASELASAVGGQGVVVLAAAGGNAARVLDAHPASLRGVELPAFQRPLSTCVGLALARGDLSALPLPDRFPTATWAVHGVSRTRGLLLVVYGRGRAPVRLVDDPVLGAALVSRVERVFERGLPTPSDALARLSHEFKTPLVSVKGYAELILDQARGGDPRVREWARRIAVGANRLAGLFRRVTSEAQAGEGGGYAPRLLEPAQWVSWGIAEARELAGGRRLDWIATVEPDCPPVRIDPDGARDALLELLQNAARATPDGGQVRVWTGPATRNGFDGVCLVVEDTGVGTPVGVEGEKLFARYTTLTDILAHHSGGFEFGASGLGLGLPMVRGIARAHGGEAWGEGRGRDASVFPGTVMRMWFPVATTEEPVGEGATGTVLRVLVLEPDAGVRHLLADGLGSETEVTVVATAREVVEAWTTAPWDGCVLEPRLDGGGVALVEHLRSTAPHDGAALIVYTVVGPGEAQAYRAVGADACVSKPARTRLLIQRLRSVLRRKDRR